VKELEEACRTTLLADYHYSPPKSNKLSRAVTCYRCGGVGHYARGCASQTQIASQQLTNKTNQQESDDRGDPTRDTKLDNPILNQYKSINNVSSYFLSCKVHGTPVSFLIDTGAGVSLLNKMVYDRIQGN